MKTIGFFLLFFTTTCCAQPGYWQQKADVKLSVRLNDKQKTLEGFETLVYTNNSPDTLQFIWFHLWPNAYKNDKTAFSDQLLQQGNTSFYFSSKDKKGYINRLDIKVAGITAKTEDHPEFIDIIKVILPAPLLPASQLTITTPFQVKLPYLFSRSGYKDGAFQLTQWYPKPAVYDAQGWHPMPYLEQGEFYSEFGDYDVTITLPQDYIVAATGVLETPEEKAWLKSRPATTAKKSPAPKKAYGHLKKFQSIKPTSDSTEEMVLKTLRFTQKNCHDFALVADKTFHIKTDTCQLSDGAVVDIMAYYRASAPAVWQESLTYAKAALRFYADAVGTYPYPNLSVVESAGTVPGGMEYPALTIIGTLSTPKRFDLVLAHEIGHQWSYGALGTNERKAPWLDEGINTFYEKKYRAQRYGDSSQPEALLLQTLVKQKKDQPITTPAPQFPPANYPLIAYYKTAVWLSGLEKKMGSELFQKSMQAYYRNWQFKHPGEADFIKSISAGMQDTSWFAWLHKTGRLPQKAPITFRLLTPLLPGTFKAYIQQPSKNALLVAPAFGYNYYDKLMAGGLITNYGLPPTKIQFLVLPLYATGARKWNGLGTVSYTGYPEKGVRKIRASLTGMGFSKSHLPDSNFNRQYERYYKLVPAVRLTLRQPVQSTRENWVEAKTFFIAERNYSKFISAADGAIYVDSLSSARYFINQLTYGATNYRTLYPYQYSVQLQEAKAFYRINLTGSYFFNYATGGAGVRLFFSKFGYRTGNASERYATTRFQPKLLGNTGVEDYTYSSYFVGRTASDANNESAVKNSGFAARQVLLRDGAFKLRLDAFDFLQGRSDNWVAALNLTTTLPTAIFPRVIPLKLFLDIGTYAGAGTQGVTNQILYAGGFQLSFFKEALSVFAPLVYSSDFRDNLQSVPEQNTFFKRLTFSINLEQLTMVHFTGNKFSF